MTARDTRPEKLDRIVQRFQRRTDPKQRYQQLLWYAKRLQSLPEASKIPANKVSGCVSQVYVTATFDAEGNVCYRGDADAQLVKGLVALLIEGLDGLPPGQILQVKPDFIAETGLEVSLTPSRANGFYNIFKTMQQKALALQTAAEAAG